MKLNEYRTLTALESWRALWEADSLASLQTLCNSIPILGDESLAVKQEYQNLWTKRQYAEFFSLLLDAFYDDFSKHGTQTPQDETVYLDEL